MARQKWDHWYERQQGYTGDPSFTGQSTDTQRWGGSRGDVVNGWIQPGTSGADKDVNRYRGLGEAAAQQTGPVIDQAASNETREMYLGSLAGLNRTARGLDSRAMDLGAQQSIDAANAQRGMAASVRGGPMARAAASRMAERSAARTGADIMNMARAGQAQEMSNARHQLVQGSTQLRGQDLGLSTSQAQLEAQQRALNEQQQQAYERMGWDTRNADMMAGEETRQREQAQIVEERKARAAQRQKKYDEMLFAGSTVLGGLTGFMSDERAKTDIVPVGSLARLMR
jgi:hypothetical protein